MVICGHQFGGNNISDWLMNSSASFPLDNSNASKILHKLIQEHFHSNELTARRLTLKTARHREKKHNEQKKFRAPRSRIRSFFDFKEFEEKEHLDGCPVKWLYRQQSIGGGSSIGGSSKSSQTPDKKPLRDRIPSEIKIKKIKLQKDTSNGDKTTTTMTQKREKLAVKLNWKEFDQNNEDIKTPIDHWDSLPTRPLTGCHPWLKVLLSPRDTCCPTPKLLKDTKERQTTVRKVSINLPELTEDSLTNRLTWQRTKKLKRGSTAALTIRLDRMTTHRDVPAKIGDEIQVISSRITFSERAQGKKSKSVFSTKIQPIALEAHR